MSSPVRSLSPEPIDYTFDTDPAPVRIQKGDAKDNTLVGDSGRDRLFGLGGDDTLVGKDSRDYLEGGDGDDRLSGGGDGMLEDRFAFDRDDGRDVLTDFVPQCEICIQIFPGPEGDRIVLLDGKPNDIAAVTKGVTETPEGDAVLHYGETTITMAGVDADRVIEEWFLLG
jgi:Ca2+-binding RTX toxin-like protein